ncbi:hypothetical protein [Marinifilum fragile]|uniref:hypothetical protein n=1 Tax=Marinifilum fragile TaxID=570161 RepID=UPI002AA91428|nr:hypothetical protein [Marinifilum fragile]
MNYKTKSTLLVVMIFIVMLLFADAFIWGDAGGRINPSKSATGEIDNIYTKLIEYTILALVLLLGLNYIKSKRQ